MLCAMVRGPGSAASHQHRLERLYRHQADAYDRFRERFLHGRKELVELLELPAGADVVELGAGTKLAGWCPIVDHTDMQLELGPSGLYMYTLALKVENMAPGLPGRIGCRHDPLVQTAIFFGAEQVGGSGAGMHAGLTSLPSYDELAGIFTPFSSFDKIEHYIGEEVRLTASITDACGDTATDEAFVIVQH
jgi:hypothetical protein